MHGARLTRRGRIWYARYWHNGERVSVSTRCTDKKAAELFARELERRAANPALAAANETTFAVAMDRWITHRTERANAGHGALATVDHYRKKLGHAKRLVGTELLADVDAPMLDRYVTTRRKEGAGEHTLSKELAAIRGTLEHAKRDELYARDPRVTVPHVSPVYVPKTRALTVSEARALVGELSAHRAAQVAWMIAVAGDWSAVARARHEDIASDYSACRVRGSKNTARDRVVPVSLPECRDLLRFALEHSDGREGFLFSRWHTVNRDMKAACERVGIANCSPNDLRRTHGQWLRSRGAPPHLIGLVLGHRDSTMAERVYARPDTSVLAELLTRSMDWTAGGPDGRKSNGQSGYSGQLNIHDSPANPLSTECRRSELNQRPWDYDSPALTI